MSGAGRSARQQNQHSHSSSSSASSSLTSSSSSTTRHHHHTRASAGNARGSASSNVAQMSAAAAASSSSSGHQQQQQQQEHPLHPPHQHQSLQQVHPHQVRAPLTLGIETAEDFFCHIIPRDTPLPCTATQLFSTYADQQPAVTIKVYQGERASTRANQLLGRFELLGLRPAPRGVPQIEVTFVMDEHGSLAVLASESLHGQVQSLTVQHSFEMPSKYWNPAHVAEVLRDAEAHRDEDEQFHIRIASKSRFEQYIYGLRTSLDHHAWSSLLTPTERNTIARVHEESIVWLRDHEQSSAIQFEEQLRQVQSVCQSIVARMYEANHAANSPQAPAIMSSPNQTRMFNPFADSSTAPPFSHLTVPASAPAAAPSFLATLNSKDNSPVRPNSLSASASPSLTGAAATSSSPSWQQFGGQSNWTHPSLLTTPMLSSASFWQSQATTSTSQVHNNSGGGGGSGSLNDSIINRGNNNNTNNNNNNNNHNHNHSSNRSSGVHNHVHMNNSNNDASNGGGHDSSSSSLHPRPYQDEILLDDSLSIPDNSFLGFLTFPHSSLAGGPLPPISLSMSPDDMLTMPLPTPQLSPSAPHPSQIDGAQESLRIRGGSNPMADDTESESEYQLRSP